MTTFTFSSSRIVAAQISSQTVEIDYESDEKEIKTVLSLGYITAKHGIIDWTHNHVMMIDMLDFPKITRALYWTYVQLSRPKKSLPRKILEIVALKLCHNTFEDASCVLEMHQPRHAVTWDIKHGDQRSLHSALIFNTIKDVYRCAEALLSEFQDYYNYDFGCQSDQILYLIDASPEKQKLGVCKLLLKWLDNSSPSFCPKTIRKKMSKLVQARCPHIKYQMWLVKLDQQTITGTCEKTEHWRGMISLKALLLCFNDKGFMRMMFPRENTLNVEDIIKSDNCLADGMKLFTKFIDGIELPVSF